MAKFGKCPQLNCRMIDKGQKINEQIDVLCVVMKTIAVGRFEENFTLFKSFKYSFFNYFETEF